MKVVSVRHFNCESRSGPGHTYCNLNHSKRYPNYPNKQLKQANFLREMRKGGGRGVERRVSQESAKLKGGSTPPLHQIKLK